MRHLFFPIALGLFAGAALVSSTWPPFLWSFAILIPLFALGVRDCLQSSHAVIRNFPVVGHMRYLLEAIRPEINQYFVESEQDGRPFNREERSIVYRRSKRALATLPFGTQTDVTQVGHEWMNHSMYPKAPLAEEPRVRIGGRRCKQPYHASLLNVSAMSYGALSKQAILALSGGARDGGFFHNTGEGGVSAYHLEGGADLVWQIGTGYFGCRDAEGRFDPELFAATARLDAVKMIEVKLSQGAKPGHGGILPKEKITPEIAAIRHVPLGQDVISPPFHTAFRGPDELLFFLDHLRDLSGGKPVGFKFCMGDRLELEDLCRAMSNTGLAPDFITIDGAEGGTGAAPLEFANSVGTPIADSLPVLDDLLNTYDLRDQVKIIASGRVLTGFHMVQRLALGADLCASARGMMMSLGCIQALRCNSNACPVGIATQDPRLANGLVPAKKRERVTNYQHETVHALMELCAAAGLEGPHGLSRAHVFRRVSPTKIQSYVEIYGVGRRPDLAHRLRNIAPEDVAERLERFKSAG